MSLGFFLFTIPWHGRRIGQVLELHSRMLHSLWGLHFHNPVVASPWTGWTYPAALRLAVILAPQAATQVPAFPNPLVMGAAP